MADQERSDSWLEIQVDRETIVLAAVGFVVLLVLAFLTGRWTAPGGRDEAQAVPAVAEHAADDVTPAGPVLDEDVDGSPQFGAVPLGTPRPVGAVPTTPVPKPAAAQTTVPKPTVSKPTATQAVPPPTAVKPAPKPVTQPAASTGAGHVVQVGAVDVRKDADALAQRLRTAGLPARVVEESGLFKVQAGPFGTLAEAQAAERRLKREMSLPTWIRRS